MPSSTAPASSPGAAATETTSGPAATDTEIPLSGPRATAQALLGQVTLNAPTAVPDLAEVGFAAAVDRACQIVRDEYVRGNFNGVDWDALCAEYRAEAETLSSEPELHALLDDLVAELGDEHSRYVGPNEFSSEFGLPATGAGRPWTGLNTWPAREWEHLYLWDVCSNGPAANAGLQRGTIVTHIYGEQVDASGGLVDSPWRTAMFGNEGATAVQLTVLTGPGSDPRVVTLPLSGASGCDGWQIGIFSESPRIGYLRIPDFDGDAEHNILDGIGQLEEQAPLDGLIVDVRHNPGGNSDAAISVFTEGVFGHIGKLREDATQTIYRIRGPAQWSDTTPVAVLIDGASHSAAEYFATAMQQSGRATIVGMPTAGNTEGITGFNVPGGGVVRLAVQILTLPDGNLIEDVGVQPDIQQPIEMWGLLDVPDIQVRAAYQALTGDELP